LDRKTQAGQQERVRRVVFASSLHFHGFLRRAVQASAAAPVRPDSLYGVAKVFGEATGRLYADKYGLEVVCLRIASFRPKPTIARELGTWLSPNDAVRLFEASLTAPNVHFEILYGTSKNRLGLYEQGRAAEMGYQPLDDSSLYEAEIAANPNRDRARRGARPVSQLQHDVLLAGVRARLPLPHCVHR
jgi:uronate dehydrogenase